MKTIIVLSGKKGVGKDTTADIIKCSFQCNNCIGTGYKDADFAYIAQICQKCAGRGTYKSVDKTSFAYPLKQICQMIFGLTDDQCYGPSVNRQLDTKIKWSDISPNFHHLKTEESGEYLTARDVLQMFGTDVVRSFYPMAWSNAALNFALSSSKDIVVFTDARFPDEIEVFKNAEKDGKVRVIVIRIERDTGIFDNHPSEVALDNYPFKLTISNNGTVSELRSMVADILDNLNV